MSFKRLAVIGIVLCAVGAGGYLWLRPSHSHAAGVQPVARPAQLAVRTHKVEEQTLPELCEYHGHVRSRRQVDVVPQVPGRIKAVHVKAGQQVKAGDLLLELDPAEFEAKVRTAEANVALADAGLVRARQHFKVIETLVPYGNATKEDLDEATAGVKSGEANVAAAKAREEEARTYLQYTSAGATPRGPAPACRWGDWPQLSQSRWRRCPALAPAPWRRACSPRSRRRRAASSRRMSMSR